MVTKANCIAVMGIGAWGTTLALQLARNGHQVRLWSHDAQLAQDIQNQRVNKIFLPDIPLPNSIVVAHQANAVMQDADAAMFVTASQFLRRGLETFKPYIRPELPLLNATKGLEESSLKTLLDVYAETLGADVLRALAVLSGPNLSAEIARQIPSTAVIASQRADRSEYFQNLLNSATFRVYTNDDVKGVYLGGTLKNVIALAAGIIEGLGYGYNARAGLIVRGITEISRLGVALGARRETFYGLSGLGDLVCTCSPLSRNFSVGVDIGRGRKLPEILGSMVSVAEGVHTARVAVTLAKRHAVDMPITQATYAILFENLDPRTAAEQLMARDPRPENI